MPNELTETSLLAALDGVKDPDLGQSIVSMGMIKDIVIADEGATVSFTCELTTPACPMREQIEKDIRDTVGEIFPQVKTLGINITAQVRENPFAASAGSDDNVLPQIKNVLLVAGAQGGVGKSTVAVNLAVALQQKGARVALLDLDLFAPALPDLTGTHERPRLHGETQIRPLEKHGMQVMSMGFLVDDKQAMMWRGPVVDGIVVQFLRDVTWNEADYLIIDLPPAQVDIPLAINKHAQVAGVALVTTPRATAVRALARTKALYEQLRMPLLGVIENAACGAPGPAEKCPLDEVLEAWKLPLLGRVPFDAQAGVCGDAGTPLVLAQPDTPAAKALVQTAEKTAAQLSVKALQGDGPSVATNPA